MYQIPADLLQAIINLLQELPAKHSFQVLQAIDTIVKSKQPESPAVKPVDQEVKKDK